jgi:tripeptidyl-peptidase-2
LKLKGIPYNPYRIKRAVVNTSKDVSDPMKVGMIQVEKAWNHLVDYQSIPLDVFYDVSNHTK